MRLILRGDPPSDRRPDGRVTWWLWDLPGKPMEASVGDLVRGLPEHADQPIPQWTVVAVHPVSLTRNTRIMLAMPAEPAPAGATV